MPTLESSDRRHLRRAEFQTLVHEAEDWYWKLGSGAKINVAVYATFYANHSWLPVDGQEDMGAVTEAVTYKIMPF